MAVLRPLIVQNDPESGHDTLGRTAPPAPAEINATIALRA